ncbi:MAG: S41 family peptidase [Bacteroidales bacterium]|nr:S41 family peptidase [Bacteroidales bacterium]
MPTMKTRTRYTVIMTVTVVALLTLGFLPQEQGRDFRIAKNLDIFFSLFREINSFYVDEVDPDKLVRTGIVSMLQTLDPYTVYYPEDEVDDIAFMTTGKYGGIGAMVRNSGDYAVVTQIYRGFPADLAGIKPGDLLVKVDGKSLKGLSTDKVSDNLKGDPGTPISVTVERNGTEMSFQLKRERVAVSPIPYYGMLDDKTAYIRFTNFTQDCAQDVRNAFTEMKEKYQPAQVILDLRGNPGGLLNEAADIVNIFVGPGNEVVSTKGKVKQFDSVFKTTRPAVDEVIPLVVLISRSSASAAEIVAGAIQDLDRGVVMGQRSYGKGLVQITRPLSYNAQLKVTTAKYYIPSGRCIQALDFTHRNEDGSVGYIPDSLISEFRTKNGRVVRDGGGIAPDIEVVPPMLSQVATELYVYNHIFDFGTQYYYKHPDVSSPSDIVIDDSIYDQFRAFLKGRNFTYRTATATGLENLIATAKREKYYDLYPDEFAALEARLAINLNKDLDLFRAEITELLEDEVVERYFYQEGAMANAATNDSTIIKAIELLKDRKRYNEILSPALHPSVPLIVE